MSLALVPDVAGHGGAYQAGFSTRRSNRAACARGPLRPDRTQRWDNSSSGLGEDDRAGLGDHHAHVAHG